MELKFEYVKVGDIIHRMFASAKLGRAAMKPMKLRVTEVDEKFIYCGPSNVGWKFRKDCGAEVDEELEWGQEKNGVVHTGSYLV